MKVLKSSKGFTLIELVAVTAITGILLTLVSAIFVQIVQSNVRATVANDIRGNGQFMIETIVRAIRSADSVSGSGASSTLSLTIQGVPETYYFKCNNLYKNDDNTQLNTTKILVSSPCDGSIGESFFNLYPAANGAPARVQITMVLKTTGSVIHTEYIGQQTFTQTVSLRTFAK